MSNAPVTYRRKKDAVDYVFQLIVYAILLAGAAWMWTFARDDFAVLFGKHVSDMSAWGCSRAWCLRVSCFGALSMPVRMRPIPSNRRGWLCGSTARRLASHPRKAACVNRGNRRRDLTLRSGCEPCRESHFPP